MTTSSTARKPIRTRAACLLGVAVAVVSTLTVGAGAAQARPRTDCHAIAVALAKNPSLAKPRGHQDHPDYRTWGLGCR